MDEDFACFLAEFGPAIDKRDVPPSTITRYRGKLPDQLLAYWEEYSWCGYADGLFRTVDPQEYEPALEAWIGDTPFMERDAYHVVGRLKHDEMYGFVPALALGGAPTLANLQKVKAVEHLAILAQLEPLYVTET